MNSLALVTVVSILVVLSAAEQNHCAARGLHQCTLTPEQTEGPYFIFDGVPQRADIKEDRQGLPLRVELVIQNTDTCAPVEGLMVHLWTADAVGDYSGFAPIQDRHFLRGYQVTDDNGAVYFDSIFPGWYTGRCTHVHIETFLPPELGGNNQTLHTTQGYFPDEIVLSLRDKSPYIDNRNAVLLNSQDGIYRQDGENLLMDVQPASQNPDIDGYVARMVLGLYLPNIPTNPPAPTDPSNPTNPSTPNDAIIPSDPSIPSDPAFPGDPSSASLLSGNLAALIFLLTPAVILIRTLSTKF